MKYFFIFVAVASLSIGCSHSSKVAEMKDAPESCRIKTELPETIRISKNPIMKAVFEEDAVKLKELIVSGQSVQSKDALGFSYLHLAAGVGNAELIDILIGAGIPVNLQAGKKYSTAAHSAVSWGKVASLYALQKHGADFGLTNSEGKTPAALALEFKNPEVLEFFRSMDKKLASQSRVSNEARD